MFNKLLGQLTFEDVTAFCEQFPEGVRAETVDHPRPYINAAALGGELQGVGEEVQEYLLDLALIASDLPQSFLDHLMKDDPAAPRTLPDQNHGIRRLLPPPLSSYRRSLVCSATGPEGRSELFEDPLGNSEVHLGGGRIAEVRRDLRQNRMTVGDVRAGF